MREPRFCIFKISDQFGYGTGNLGAGLYYAS